MDASKYGTYPWSYKGASWTLIATLVIGVVLVLTAIFMYLHAGITLNRAQNIGKRFEQECGREPAEAETERYSIYRAFEERNLKQVITNVVLILRAIVGIMIMGVAVAYGLWTWFIFKEQPAYELNIFGVSVKDWWGALIIFGIAASLLLTAAAASWVRATDASNYNKTMVTPDANKTPTQLLEDLREARTQTRGIDSPWFSIVVMIVYAVVLAALTWNYTGNGQSTSTLPFPKRVKASDVYVWVAIVLLYVFAILAVWVVDRDVQGLFANIRGSYHAKKTALQTAIQSLFSDATPPPTLTQKARQYFKTVIEQVLMGVEVNANSIKGATGDYAGELWKFIQHKAGKEMDELYTQNSEKIDEIRKWALSLRMTSASTRLATQRFCRNAIVFPMIIIVALLFMAFNFLSRSISSTSVAIGSLLGVFALTVVISWFGWFSSALLL